jgi:hypothetical protein
MSDSWKPEELKTEEEVLEKLAQLQANKRWLCRGQSKRYHNLMPSIDHETRTCISRIEKLTLERRSIEIFRRTAHFFAHPGEQNALTDDIATLMVLRHYGVPTRLLDWTKSPFVAAYFAVCDHKNHDMEDGEIWCFDMPTYEQNGKKQWRAQPWTTIDGSGDDDKFDAKLTAFALDEPKEWFAIGFYPMGFPRQHAQEGVYSITPNFNCDHAEAVAKLLNNPSLHRLYVIKADLKSQLRSTLREKYNIWRGSLFPDTAGAAANIKKVVFGEDT